MTRGSILRILIFIELDRSTCIELLSNQDSQTLWPEIEEVSHNGSIRCQGFAQFESNQPGQRRGLSNSLHTVIMWPFLRSEVQACPEVHSLLFHKCLDLRLCIYCHTEDEKQIRGFWRT